MVRSILRRIVRGLPATIPGIGILVVLAVVWSQNHTTVLREGEFHVLTPDEVCDRFPSRTLDGADSDTSPNTLEPPSEALASAKTLSTPVAKKYVLYRRGGLQLFDRGHLISHEAEIPEFYDRSPFLRLMNEHLRQHALDVSREFVDLEWSTVMDGFRDPSFSFLNWDGETRIDLLFVSSDAVSLAEYRHEYTGGAHGNHWVVGRNYVSVDNGVRELKLNDLFDAESDWLRTLLRVCLTDLHRQGASRVDESYLKDPLEFQFSTDDLASFTLSSDGMRFYFSPYHMGCYAEGLYSAHVDYSDVAEFVPANSPLRRFMVNPPAVARK